MTALHTVDMYPLNFFVVSFKTIFISLKKIFKNASLLEYCNMHICQDQKLFEGCDYNIISYVKISNIFSIIFYEVCY